MAMTETSTAPALPVWSLGDRLRKAREHAGLSRDELADKLGVKKNSLWNWETNASQPRDLLDVVERWAQATGVPAAWIGGFTPMYLRDATCTLDAPVQNRLPFDTVPFIPSVVG